VFAEQVVGDRESVEVGRLAERAEPDGRRVGRAYMILSSSRVAEKIGPSSAGWLETPR
jgi:hypothetical protein